MLLSIITAVNIILIIILAILIYVNRGKNNKIVLVLFALSIIIFVANYLW